MKLLRLLDEKLEEYLILISFSLIVIIINLEVVNRYIITWIEIGNITTWTEELARYIFIWMVYISCAYAIKKRSHITIDFFVRMLPPRIKLVSFIIADLCFIVICYVIMVKSLPMLDMQMTQGQLSPALRIPIWIPYSIVPLGFGLMQVRLIQQLVLSFKKLGGKEAVK